MFKKNVVTCSLFTLLLVCLFCGDEENPSGPGTTGTAESFGTFRVTLKPENNTGDPSTRNPAYTQVLGTMYDGPVPLDILFEEKMSEGECRLLKTINPLCDPACDSNWKCIQTDSCMQYPSRVNVGEVTVNGLKYNDAKITFTLKPMNLSFGWIYQKTGMSLDYPPFAEGDTVTFAAAGSDSVSSFTLKAPAITPLKVLTQTAELVDSQSITLNWEPPAIQGI